jgi:hypothetical protein
MPSLCSCMQRCYRHLQGNQLANHLQNCKPMPTIGRLQDHCSIHHYNLIKFIRMYDRLMLYTVRSMSSKGCSVGLTRSLPTRNHSWQAKYSALYHRQFKPLPMPEYLQDLDLTCITIHAMPGIQSCRIRHECLHPDKPCILPASQPLSRQVHLDELYFYVVAVGSKGCTIVPYVVWFTNFNICCHLELDYVVVLSHVPSIAAISAFSGISWHINGDVHFIHQSTVHMLERRQSPSPFQWTNHMQLYQKCNQLCWQTNASQNDSARKRSSF